MNALAAPPLLDRLADFAAALDPARLPVSVRHEAKLCVLDAASASITIGATEGSAAALALLDGPGPARILGRSERATPDAAAFVNAVSAAATIRTDTHPASASHPGMVVVPAVLACGEAARIDGAAALAGIVAGYEFMIRLGLALVTPELAAVFRPTGLLGPGAAAFAVATALRLDRAATVSATALGCHNAAGFNEWVAAGTIEHIYHAGFAARAGIAAIRLAQAGATASPTLIDGRAGLLVGFGALDRLPALTAGLGTEFRLLDTVHKPAPACIFAQAPAQAALRLLAAHPLDPADIERVDIVTTDRAVSFPGCDNPDRFTDPPGVQQSIQFSVAAVLAAGAVHEQLWACPADPHVARLAARCRLHADPAATGARQPVRLTVYLTGGRTLDAAVDDFTSMSETEIVDRFLRAATPVLGQARAQQALDATMRLEALPDVNDLTSLLVPA